MFRTKIESSQLDLNIEHSHKILAIGSCFSESIGQKLYDAKFDVLVNPFGTLFNPISIFNLLEMSIDEDILPEDSITKQQEMYLTHLAHSSIKSISKEGLNDRFNKITSLINQRLREAQTLIITFGTAWIYEHNTTEQIVANCHKVPQKEFNKRLLQVDEIMTSFFGLKERLEAINPQLQIILTVSPVRHTKDTLTLNSVSKANLRLATHYMQEMANDVHYFPSYEMVMDDLRDYRFFKSDMIHPNEQAIDYIWDYFKKSTMSKKTQKLVDDWAKLSRAIDHKPFNPESAAHQKFLDKTITKLENLSTQLPLSNEIEQLKRQLK